MIRGTVIQSTGAWTLVRTDAAGTLRCRIKGKLRLQDITGTNPLAAGDNVLCKLAEDGTATIHEVLERRNYIARKSPRKKHGRHIVAANLDQVAIIATVTEPNLKPGFIDRCTVLAEMYHVTPIVVINKVDLLEKDDPDIDSLKAIFQTVGYAIHFVSALRGDGLNEFQRALEGKVTLLTGHSGVGKSTLLNELVPGLNLKTKPLSKHSGKGQHSTTYARMQSLKNGGDIIDTPGIKEISVPDLQMEEVAQYFPEMRRRLERCKFNNCQHVEEPLCAVIAALESGEIAESRYFTYLAIRGEIESLNYWEI